MDWKRYRKKIKKYDTKKELQILSYTIQATPRTIFISSTYNYPSTPIHDCYRISKITLVLFLTLYKFIVWACWARTRSCFGFQVRTVFTYRYTINKIMHLNKAKKKKSHRRIYPCVQMGIFVHVHLHIFSPHFSPYFGEKKLLVSLKGKYLNSTISSPFQPNTLQQGFFFFFF